MAQLCPSGFIFIWVDKMLVGQLLRPRYCFVSERGQLLLLCWFSTVFSAASDMQSDEVSCPHL